MAATATPASFVKKAAQGGMAEVELGKLALSKSQDAEIRKFAGRMVQDHGKANTELSAIAARKNLEVPRQLDAKHSSMVDELRTKSGEQFDKAYAAHMNADHTEAVSLFEGASRTADAELAQFAKKTLPTLKEHKKMAARLHSQMRSAKAPAAGSER